MKKSILLLALCVMGVQTLLLGQSNFKTVEEAVAESDYVFEGYPIKADDFDDPTNGKHYSLYVVEVLRVFKGNLTTGTAQVLYEIPDKDFVIDLEDPNPSGKRKNVWSDPERHKKTDRIIYVCKKPETAPKEWFSGLDKAQILFQTKTMTFRGLRNEYHWYVDYGWGTAIERSKHKNPSPKECYDYLRSLPSLNVPGDIEEPFIIDPPQLPNYDSLWQNRRKMDREEMKKLMDGSGKDKEKNDQGNIQRGTTDNNLLSGHSLDGYSRRMKY